MWVELALVIAGLIYAIAQNAGTAAQIIPMPPVDETADLRYHVQYLQQLLAVQAAQIANINAIYGFMLPVVLFLLQFVAAPIENEFVRWILYAAYSILALIMLAFVGMRRPELYSSDDPLARGQRVSLSVADLTETHSVLHTLLGENETTLRTKHRALPYVLLVGIAITIIGGAYDGTQRPHPQSVSFPTPVPVLIQTPTPNPTPSPTPTPSPAPTPTPTPTPTKKPMPSASA